MSKTKESVHIYTVTELTRQVRDILELKFTDIWIQGEISNFTYHSSGHMYFSLKDENSQLRAAMFKGKNLHLKFKPQDGLKVTAYGKLSVYDRKGEYQLIVEYLEPAGLGALMLAFEQLKKKLQKEGLFDESHKVQIPPFPQRVGIITSPTGAAIRDILNIINRRFANIHVTIYPVRVQGEGSALEISNAIKEMNVIGGFDVLIVGRGGGSLEDLWAFNEEIVARAIYESSIPVISAVGHEVDWTIADYVSDLRAPTPSAAAELVVKDKNEVLQLIKTQNMRLKNAFLNVVGSLKEKLQWLSKSIAAKRPDAKIRQMRQDLDNFLGRLEVKMKHNFEIQNKNLKVLSGKLHALSPLAVLNRGYSVTFKMPEETVIKNSKNLSIGDEVKIRFSKGCISAKVKEVS